MTQAYAAWGFTIGFFVGMSALAGILRLVQWHEHRSHIRRLDAEWKWHNRGWNDPS